MTDKELTRRFQWELKQAGVTLPISYEWSNEPLYRGDPLEPKASPAEEKAIKKMYAFIKSEAGCRACGSKHADDSCLSESLLPSWARPL